VLTPVSKEFGDPKLDSGWIYGFSCLRDARRQEVRFFFDSTEELARQVEHVLYMRPATGDILKDAKVSDCRLELISDPTVQAIRNDKSYGVEEEATIVLEGWQLTCPDHSAEAEIAVLVYADKYASFQIETIHPEKLGRIAACVGPLYTKRRFTKPWIFFNTKMGIERINIYHTVINNVTSHNSWFSGMWPSSELNQPSPVEMFPHSSVRWFSYEAAPNRYYHGQTTALNDCLARNRYSFDYLAILDVDEVIRINEGPRFGLAELLDQHFPHNASNMVVPRYNFPEKCCDNHLHSETSDDEDTSVRFFESCKNHIMKDHDHGKSIVRPALVEALSQHITLIHRNGFDTRVTMDPAIAHLVHVNRNAGWGIQMDCEQAHEGFEKE